MSEQQDADLINAAVQDPVPEMNVAPSTTITLLRGLYDPSSKTWHSDAEVRELTGEDEEYLAGIEKTKDLLYTEYMSHLLARAVVRIGSIVLEPKTALQVVGKLILGDRDMLYLAVMRATYGDTRGINMMCPSCGTMNDVELDLDEDFPIQEADFDLRKGIKVKTSKGAITLRLPSSDDIVSAQRATKSDAELNTHVLSKCVIWPDGKAPDDPLKWARSLNISDRKKLVNTLLEVELGPKMGEVNTQCASCGDDMPILLDWVSLLLS